MGLSIHYSGTIKEYSSIPQLIEETVDICKSFQWTYRVIDDEQFKGVLFSPPESEPVTLTFNNDGRLLSPLQADMADVYEKNGIERDAIFTSFTKTQFAGPEVHMSIIHLLKYISKKYFEVFALTDEGYYWETGDKQQLLQQFSKYNFLLNTVSDALSDIKLLDGESTEGLADRIEKVLKEKLGNIDNKDFTAPDE